MDGKWWEKTEKRIIEQISLFLGTRGGDRPKCIIDGSDLWLVTLLIYRNIAEQLELCCKTRLNSNTTFADDICCPRSCSSRDSSSIRYRVGCLLHFCRSIRVRFMLGITRSLIIYVIYYYACADTLMPHWKFLKKENIQSFEEKQLSKISLAKGRQHKHQQREKEEGPYPTLRCQMSLVYHLGKGEWWRQLWEWNDRWFP